MLATNALRTVVYQSYGTHDVAGWLQRCMVFDPPPFRIELPLLTNVGSLSPVVARDITARDGRPARGYATAHGTPMRAANLGASRRGVESSGITPVDSDDELIVDVLEWSLGGIFNDAFAAYAGSRGQPAPASQSRAVRKWVYSLASALPGSGRQS